YVPDYSQEPAQPRLIEAPPERIAVIKSGLSTAEPLTPPPSVTEQTTHHLSDSPKRVRESG
ncbi:MAG TPA: hypothetical protein VFB82_23880, partial [Blastocatellia bacterium]|nr:hypothetical protein [Blastocatellia bacterium]